MKPKPRDARPLRGREARRKREWFAALPEWQVYTGFDQVGWPASRWVLHAMHRRSPTGEVDLQDRLRWLPMLAEHGIDPSLQPTPPSTDWFPWRTWPADIDPPSEGSLDAGDLAALLTVLAAHSADGAEQECLVSYGGLAAGDVDAVNVYRLPLQQLPGLLRENGGGFRSTPSNVWPVDRSWFLWTDWDLSGTKVSGTDELMQALDAAPDLEVIAWSRGGAPAADG